MSKTKLTAVSLFSGCGGFDLGLHQQGVDIIWANDIDPHAAHAYRSILPETEFYEGDIKNVEKFPQADILIGCYPCTGFSLGSRRRSSKMQKSGIEKRDLTLNDTNFLYKEFLRALEAVNPKYLFVENVKGMLSAQKGWFLQQQISGFEKLGYQIATPKVLNAIDYGVPQSRQRIFLVGVRNDLDIEYNFPEPTHNTKGTKHPIKTLQDTITGMPEWPTGEFLDYKFHGHFLTRNRKRNWNQPSYTIVAHSHHIPLHPMGEPMKKVGVDNWVLQGAKNRRLSWRECARIQGLPDNISPSGSLHDKYRVIGNAVPPLFSKVLVEPILKYERE